MFHLMIFPREIVFSIFASYTHKTICETIFNVSKLSTHSDAKVRHPYSVLCTFKPTFKMLSISHQSVFITTYLFVHYNGVVTVHVTVLQSQHDNIISPAGVNILNNNMFELGW